MNIALVILSAVVCYLFGSINSSIIVGKCFKLGDIREHGSGNAGATNTLRVLGKKAAVWTLLGDVIKTVIAVLIAMTISKFIKDAFLAELSLYLSCFSTALGHNYPVFFNFRGGKGVLTSGVIIIMLSPVIGTVTVLCCILVIALTRYVSLGSMTGGVLYPIWIILYYPNNKLKIIFSVVLGAMLVIKHSANIKRLISGTESKLGAKKE